MIKMLKRTNYNNTYYVTDQEYSLPPEIEERWCRNGIAETVGVESPKDDIPKEPPKDGATLPKGELPKDNAEKKGFFAPKEK